MKAVKESQYGCTESDKETRRVLGFVSQPIIPVMSFLSVSIPLSRSLSFSVARLLFQGDSGRALAFEALMYRSLWERSNEGTREGIGVSFGGHRQA